MKPVRRSFLGLAAAALLLAMAGCGRESVGLAPETDEPAYREGVQLERENKINEALLSYLKVIAKRGDQAPESTLEVGLIELEHMRDPITAIYYFKKYLQLEPNSSRADEVRGQIALATRDFAATLPGQPLDGQVAHPELLEELNRLQRENEELRSELAALRGGGAAPGAEASESASAPSPPLIASPQVVTESAEESAPPAVVPAPAPEAPPNAAPAPAPAPPAGRTYVVQPHDTLFAIAKRCYGLATNARVQAILEANRGTISSARDLRPGMVLKIP